MPFNEKIDGAESTRLHAFQRQTGSKCMDERLLEIVDVTIITTLLKEMNWPISLFGENHSRQLVSAVNGVNFNICFGTRAADEAGWTDFTLSAPFSDRS